MEEKHFHTKKKKKGLIYLRFELSISKTLSDFDKVLKNVSTFHSPRKR